MITIKIRNGNRTRRCDSRCHNAKGKKCCCLCGGTYHGVGRMLRVLVSQNQKSLISKLEADGNTILMAQISMDFGGD